MRGFVRTVAMISVLGVLGPAAAAAEARVHLSFSVFGRSVPSLDLAAKAGESRFGTGDDAGALAMGVLGSLGLELSPVEVGVDFALGAGGLDQTDIDDRYLGGSAPAIGASTREVGGHVWWVHRPSGDLQFMVGPHVRWFAMFSASDLGEARAKSLGFGGQAGLRWRTHRLASGIDGSVRIMASGHGNVPLHISVRRAETDLFTTNDPTGTFFDYGLSIGYGLTFR